MAIAGFQEASGRSRLLRTFGPFRAIRKPMLDSLIYSNEYENALAQTRDLLLPKLMSGEIRLTEAEKAVEAVA